MSAVPVTPGNGNGTGLLKIVLASALTMLGTGALFVVRDKDKITRDEMEGYVNKTRVEDAKLWQATIDTLSDNNDGLKTQMALLVTAVGESTQATRDVTQRFDAYLEFSGVKVPKEGR